MCWFKEKHIFATFKKNVVPFYNGERGSIWGESGVVDILKDGLCLDKYASDTSFVGSQL